MAVLANRVKVAVDGTPGTGTIDLGAAVTGFQSFADGGVTNGQVVSYAIEDGDDWEVGTGTYTTGTPNTLSRTVIESSNSDAPLDLSSNAVVFITALSGDLQNAVDMDQGVATTDSPAFAGITATGDVDIADKIVHTGDTNTSIRFPAADTVTVETAGSERVRVDSSGNVGIGTSSPAEELDVNGTIKATNVSDGTLSIPTTYVTNGSSKAWMHYNHNTATINQSFNTSSVTDAAVGEATYTYSSALDAANYCLQVSGKTDDDNTDSIGNRIWVRPFGSTTTTGSSLAVDVGGTARDCNILCHTTLGDLA